MVADAVGAKAVGTGKRRTFRQGIEPGDLFFSVQVVGDLDGPVGAYPEGVVVAGNLTAAAQEVSAGILTGDEAGVDLDDRVIVRLARPGGYEIVGLLVVVDPGAEFAVEAFVAER